MKLTGLMSLWKFVSKILQLVFCLTDANAKITCVSPSRFICAGVTRLHALVRTLLFGSVVSQRDQIVFVSRI